MFNISRAEASVLDVLDSHVGYVSVGDFLRIARAVSPQALDKLFLEDHMDCKGSPFDVVWDCWILFGHADGAERSDYSVDLGLRILV